MDYFRYTHVGASHVLKAAGLAVRSVHLVGGSELTSAWLLGFGSGDMQPPQLDDASILHEVDRRNMSKPSDELFMAVGLLAPGLVTTWAPLAPTPVVASSLRVKSDLAPQAKSPA